MGSGILSGNVVRPLPLLLLPPSEGKIELSIGRPLPWPPLLLKGPKPEVAGERGGNSPSVEAGRLGMPPAPHVVVVVEDDEDECCEKFGRIVPEETTGRRTAADEGAALADEEFEGIGEPGEVRFPKGAKGMFGDDDEINACGGGGVPTGVVVGEDEVVADWPKAFVMD